MEIENIYNWKLGETLIVDRTHIHCASSNIVEKTWINYVYKKIIKYS